MTDNPTKRPRGRPFEKGNHGRPAGSKNRKTQILGSRSNEDRTVLNVGLTSSPWKAIHSS